LKKGAVAHAMKDTPASVEIPDLRPYGQSLPLALLRARESVMARLRPFLREHGVTEQQWRVLRTLNEVDEIEVTALADMICLLPSSLSRILRDLGARGLIQRRVSAEDQRRGLVSILEPGLDLIREVAPEAVRANQEIEAAFGKERIAALKATLNDLCDTLGESDGPKLKSSPSASAAG